MRLSVNEVYKEVILDFANIKVALSLYVRKVHQGVGRKPVGGKVFPPVFCKRQDNCYLFLEAIKVI